MILPSGDVSLRDVSIVGIGQTKVAEHWEKSIRDLGVEAIRAALRDAEFETADALYVGNALAGELVGQEHLAALLADWAGLRGIEALRVEAAAASGAAALHMAYLAVASGLHDIVVVCGVEKTTDVSPEAVTAALASGGDSDHEALHGATLEATNALIMRRYMYEYRIEHSEFAPFVVNAHRNALNNPNAMFRFSVTADAYERANVVADPINVLDCAPMSDGAAALVLCPSERAKKSKSMPIRIAASAVATDRIALHDRHDPLFLQAAWESATRAYHQAGVGPEDIDFFELHDGFTIMTALSLEACDFAERGQAVRLAQEGEIGLTGRIPICTMGGLKARGHPLGATGVYQVVEAVLQLRGQAGDNQVKDCRLAMTQSLGGSGATAITHILGYL